MRIIGRLTFTLGGKRLVAELDHRAHWHCPEDLNIEEHLNAFFTPEHTPYSVADGEFGARYLSHAADDLAGLTGADVTREWLAPATVHEPGTIY